MDSAANHGLREDILLVDDTPDNLRVLSAMLTNQGFEVRKALNGKQALASVQADPPNLILLDIKMPEMDGYTVCQNLKSDPRTCEVPVIFISALDDALDKIRAFAAGGVDYVTKPFQEMEVLARIEHQLCIQRLQQQLIQHNQELARSNRELEQFAYVVSHDLQQPLQSITGFAKVIHLKYEDHLDEAAVNYLNRIHNAGERMQQLIQDLLIYSKVGQQNREFQQVDLNFILKQALDNLQVAIAEKKVVLTHDLLPTLIGHETQLIQLIQNLISNAIKFISSDVIPRINISVAQQGNHWLFGVQDNGIGIDSQDIDHVFEIFRRTESTQNYAGTGIGLATCKKIVENHGGRIWANSQVNQGSTFYFTLSRDIATVT